MTDAIYLWRNGEADGPYTVAAVRDMVRNGKIAFTDQFAFEGGEEWREVEEIMPKRAQVKARKAGPTLSLATTKPSKWEVFLASVVLIGTTIFIVGYYSVPRWIPKTPERAVDGMRPLESELLPSDQVETIRIEPTFMDRHIGENRHATAYKAATNLIAGKLIAPASATYSPLEQTKIIGRDKTFEVIGTVDSQNVKGAMIRKDFRIFFERNGTEWKAVLLKIEPTF